MNNLEIKDSDVSQEISPNDEMFSAGSAGNESRYFGVGRSALKRINYSLEAAQISPIAVKRILDLPCGHGRVLRYLKSAFPEAEITACDLLRDGVDFCASTFGAIPVYSNEDPTKISLERNSFDLIWVGSLLTHFDSNQWPDFLNFFRDCLRPGGVMVFTTHGRETYRRIVEDSSYYHLPYWRNTAVVYGYERSGFGYANYSSSNIYGISLCEPAWVCTQLARLSDIRLVHFSESSWDNHHDVFACVRDPNWQMQSLPISNFTFRRHQVTEFVYQLKRVFAKTK